MLFRLQREILCKFRLENLETISFNFPWNDNNTNLYLSALFRGMWECAHIMFHSHNNTSAIYSAVYMVWKLQWNLTLNEKWLLKSPQFHGSTILHSYNIKNSREHLLKYWKLWFEERPDIIPGYPYDSISYPEHGKEVWNERTLFLGLFVFNCNSCCVFLHCVWRR